MASTVRAEQDSRADDTAGEPAETGSRRSRERLVLLAQTLGGAAVLGGLMQMRWGYRAGIGDHLVLSALGLHWAKPDEFANDWVIANAPQPHWLFDVVTWAGASSGTLPAVYFLYWVVSLLVFGYATALLARGWAGTLRWATILAVSVVIAATPIWLLGTGSPNYPIAVPGVLAGYLIYLTAAALLLGRHRLAAVAAVATALVHVQQGLVVVVLLAALAVAVWLRSRRFDRWLLGGAGLSAVAVGVALQARPVAGHLSDFADACNKIIPYHCNATTWLKSDARGGLALLALALLTVLYLARSERFRWFVVVVLPTVALLGGLAADRWNVPFFGVLAQGLNIYRLDVLLMPLSIWGLLTPLLVTSLGTRARWALLAAVLFLGHSALGQQGWAVEKARGGPWTLIAAGALILAVAAMTVPGLVRRPHAVTWSVLVLIAVSAVASGVYSNALKARPVTPAFMAAEHDMRDWGVDAQKVIPPGSQVLIPPVTIDLRMALRRGVVVDCKNGPYGGPAWQDYKTRIEALGGFPQCLGKYQAFNDLPPSSVSATAQKYGANYMVVDKGTKWRLASLVSLGWTVVQRPAHGYEGYVLKAPWAPAA